jgi:hypothetical protein
MQVVQYTRDCCCSVERESEKNTVFICLACEVRHTGTVQKTQQKFERFSRQDFCELSTKIHTVHTHANHRIFGRLTKEAIIKLTTAFRFNPTSISQGHPQQGRSLKKNAFYCAPLCKCGYDIQVVVTSLLFNPAATTRRAKKESDNRRI